MGSLDIRKLRRALGSFRDEIGALKRDHTPADGKTWFGYDTLGNVEVFHELLGRAHRDLATLIRGGPVADIGAADGDLAFFLARHGVDCHIVDHAPTNWNGLDAARKLKQLLDSPVEIHDIDIDGRCELPLRNYGLVLFLGLLYHLKNPYYVLEHLAEVADHCLISTKVARWTPDRKVQYRSLPLAYLLDSAECNDDPTNYWVFSDASLRRILDRTGWDVLAWLDLGDTELSNPRDLEHDERAYALLRSRVRYGVRYGARLVL